MNREAAMLRVSQAWNARTRRERWLLLILGITASACLWYALLWRPAEDARRERVDRISRLEAARSDLARLPASVRLMDPDTAQDLRELVTRSAAAQSIRIQRIEDRGDRIELTIEAVEFARFVRWLDVLARDASVHASEASLKRKPEPGMVSAEVVLARS